MRIEIISDGDKFLVRWKRSGGWKYYNSSYRIYKDKCMSCDCGGWLTGSICCYAGLDMADEFSTIEEAVEIVNELESKIKTTNKLKPIYSNE